jgi:hypothetical protein
VQLVLVTVTCFLIDYADFKVQMLVKNIMMESDGHTILDLVFNEKNILTILRYFFFCVIDKHLSLSACMA